MDFTNPVLNADRPDPDVVRVGDDYFMVVSSFNRAPGLPVLHSRDLVTWEVVARTLPTLPPETHYRLPRRAAGEPVRGDDFTATRPGPQWHWRANPSPDWVNLPGDGTLRPRVLPDDVGDPRLLPRVLGQPLPGRPSEWTTSMTLGPSSAGTRAGLVILGAEYAWVGIEETPAGAHVLCRRSSGRRQEHTLAQEALSVGVRTVSVRAGCDAEGTVGFAWRGPGAGAWREVDTRFRASAGRWIGADVGVFAAAPLGTPNSEDHVAFGTMSVDLVGSEEVAA